MRCGGGRAVATLKFQLLFFRFPSGTAGRTGTGAGRSEYHNDPRKTITAPPANWTFQPPSNHHTLKHRLIAFRAVSTTCVDTADALYMTPKKWW